MAGYVASSKVLSEVMSGQISIKPYTFLSFKCTDRITHPHFNTLFIIIRDYLNKAKHLYVLCGQEGGLALPPLTLPHTPSQYAPVVHGPIKPTRFRLSFVSVRVRAEE